LSLIYYYWLQI